MSWFLDDLAAKAAERERAGLTRRLATRDGDALLDLAGNDYLGLTTNADVILGATAATRRYGSGAGASRLVTGTLPTPHQPRRPRRAPGAPPPLRQWRRGVTAGHGHPADPRPARGRPGRTARGPQCTGVLHRLSRQPRCGYRPGRRRHPDRLGRPHPCLAH